MPKTKEAPGKLAPGQWKKECEPAGTLHGPGTLFIRGDAGEANGEVEGVKETFELACDGFGGAPIIRCVRTGLFYTLSWSDLINMAIRAGITREPDPFTSTDSKQIPVIPQLPVVDRPSRRMRQAARKAAKDAKK